VIEDIKGYTKCRKWGGLGCQGHGRSLEIAPFDRARQQVRVAISVTS